MKKIKTSEKEMAKFFIDYFIKLGFEIFQEVDTPYGTCDFIAKKDNTIIAVETKTTFNFSVLEQAINNINFSNCSYIAVPKAKDRRFQRKVAKDYGVGVLEIDFKKKTINEMVSPKYNNLPKKKVSLYDFHKENEAGTKGERLTSFKDYINSIKDLLIINEKMTYSDIYKETRKHYSNVNSFKNSIKKYIDKKVPITDGLYYDKEFIYMKK